WQETLRQRSLATLASPTAGGPRAPGRSAAIRGLHWGGATPGPGRPSPAQNTRPPTACTKADFDCAQNSLAASCEGPSRSPSNLPHGPSCWPPGPPIDAGERLLSCKEVSIG